MLDSFKHFLIGAPLPTRQLTEERLNKVRALAAFSPGALSSIAYANQEIYLALILAGSLGLSKALPVSLVITALLGIVALSYYQTIYGYPSGGGSYVVARENLGVTPGLLAASALLVDYLLTAAVSLVITALLGIVALSYYQTIYGYPSGGGSYVVARENLGVTPGVLAPTARCAFWPVMFRQLPFQRRRLCSR